MKRVLKICLSLALKFAFVLFLFLAFITYFLFIHAKDNLRNITALNFLIKPIINSMVEHGTVDFNKVDIVYLSKDKKIRISVDDLAFKGEGAPYSAIFNDFSFEMNPSNLFNENNFLDGFYSNFYKIQISDVVDNDKKQGKLFFSKQYIEECFDTIFASSIFLYGKNIELNNGYIENTREDGSVLSVALNKVQGIIHDNKYDLIMVFDKESHLSNITFEFQKSNEMYSFNTKIQQLNLLNLKHFFSKSKYKDALIDDSSDSILNANIKAIYDSEGVIRNGGLELKISSEASRGSRQLKSLDLDITIDDNFQNIDIKSLDIEFGNKSKIMTTMKAKFEPNGIFSSSSYIPENLDINQTLSNIEFDQLIYFFPKGVNDNLKEWMRDNLYNGVITEGVNQIHLDKNFFIKQVLPQNGIKCNLIIKNVILDYYDEHPNVIISKANVDFFNDHFFVNSTDIKTDTNLVFDTITAKIPYTLENLEIKGSGKGDVSSIIEFINEEDHQVLKKEGLNFSNLKSNLSVDFNVLVKSTPVEKIEDVKFVVDVKSIDHGKYSFDDVQYAINNLNINISSDMNLLLKGTFAYEMVPIEFLYDNSKPTANDKLTLKVTVTDKSLADTNIGKNVSLSNGDLIFNVKSVEDRGYQVLCDATANEIKLKKSKLTKKINSPLNLMGYIDSFNMAKFSLTDLVVTGEEINFKSEVKKNKNNIEIKIFDAQVGKNSFLAEYSKINNDKKLTLNASYLDLSSSLGDLIELDDEEDVQEGDVKYDIKVNKAKFADNIFYKNIVLQLSCVGNFCQEVKFDAEISDKYFVKIEQIEGQDKDKLLLTCDNAGLFFKSIGVYSDIEGGVLRIDLNQNMNKTVNGKEKLGFIGQASIYDFSTKNSSFLARLVLGLTTIDGIATMFANKNLQFKSMLINIDYADGVILLEHGLLSGTSIEITADGSIDLMTKHVILKGSLIPSFYGINKVVSNIPLVGTLLSGGKGGVIDAKYTVEGDFGDLKTTVNPLSILPLSFFKNLFN